MHLLQQVWEPFSLGEYENNRFLERGQACVCLSVFRFTGSQMHGRGESLIKTKALCPGLFALLNFNSVLEFRVKSQLISILTEPWESAGAAFWFWPSAFSVTSQRACVHRSPSCVCNIKIKLKRKLMRCLCIRLSDSAFLPWLLITHVALIVIIYL